jgi:tetratricopeptide (TPR) repeat protein
MAELERVLLPRPRQSSPQRQKTHVLRGLGGMGKTQLAVEFARRYHRRFSSVLWLDGRSEDILKRSIASCARRIPPGQIPETSRRYAADGSADINAVVKDVMAWLARLDNTAWLLIFDNVDREYASQGGDPNAYDVKRYLSGAEHGSVLVTTRLARLEQLGEWQQLGKVSKEQAQAIFKSWYKTKYGKLGVTNNLTYVVDADEVTLDSAEGEQLLAQLDGLPLAIAQAGAYLQESGVGLTTYLRFYEQQWGKLMESEHPADAPLLDYPDRSVWTTWAISFQAIREKHAATANLLLLWSFLDNKDLWHGLFATACKKSTVVASLLSGWLGEMATSELDFSQAMRLLRNYSLVEEVVETTSYSTHPVVHQWAHHSQGKHFATELSRLAIITVGCTVLDNSTRDYSTLQRRLLPHAQVCSKRLIKSATDWWLGIDKVDSGRFDGDEQCAVILEAIHLLGTLYKDQGKLGEAEKMYERALRGREEVLGPTHTLTLNTVNNLGNLYKDQGKLGEAEKMYERALRGYEEALGPTHTLTLNTVNNLGILYKDQGKLGEAEKMFERALRGYEEALGPTHTSTLDTVNNLGNLYLNQGKLGEAEKMFERALRGYEEALGPTHTSTLDTVNNLGNLYLNQGKLGEAEKMYERALRGYKEALGTDGVRQYLPALNTIQNIGSLYEDQGEAAKAQSMYAKALYGLRLVLGQCSDRCIDLAARLDALRTSQIEGEHQTLSALSERPESQHNKSKEGCNAVDTKAR